MKLNKKIDFEFDLGQAIEIVTCFGDPVHQLSSRFKKDLKNEFVHEAAWSGDDAILDTTHYQLTALTLFMARLGFIIRRQARRINYVGKDTDGVMNVITFEQAMRLYNAKKVFYSTNQETGVISLVGFVSEDNHSSANTLFEPDLKINAVDYDYARACREIEKLSLQYVKKGVEIGGGKLYYKANKNLIKLLDYTKHDTDTL